jgi:hypothetical protein
MVAAPPYELCQDAADILLRIKNRLGDNFDSVVGVDIAKDTSIFFNEIKRTNDTSEMWADLALDSKRQWETENV